MRIKWLVAGILVLAYGSTGLFGAATEPSIGSPDTIGDDPALLVQTKQALASGHGPTDALDRLKQKADRLLKMHPRSVMDKAKPGPSGDKHDYVSYARYYWPNPATSDGLPFVRKDGHPNLEQIALGDGPAYEKTLGDVHTLGLAYWYTGQEAYAQQAVQLVHTWFLEPATRMNPNLKYAAATLGSSQGRGSGLIEDRGIVGLLDGLSLLKGSTAWSDADQEAMHLWIKQFGAWVRTSKEGQNEKAAANNHGSWYAVQDVSICLYLHKTDEARQVLDAVKGRIVRQIEPDGRQPLEIVRADGYSYSVFNLDALMMLADMGQRPGMGVDLWKSQQGDRGIQSALNYLMPFAAGQKQWPKGQLVKISAESLVPLVARAADIYKDPQYTKWLQANHASVELQIDDSFGE